MNSDEFSPYQQLNRLINLWWLVALVSILGGVFGIVFFQLHPPLYEATATYTVTIDLDRFPVKDIREDMLQYNEDMALNTTKAILLLPEVTEEVIAELDSQGLSITSVELLKNYTIEREHDTWELRYRNENPGIAQTVVNKWADIGFQAMLSRQAAGEAPDYVVFEPPSPASLPQEPVLYGRNRVVFAGIALGFIVAVLASSLVGRFSRKPPLEP